MESLKKIPIVTTNLKGGTSKPVQPQKPISSNNSNESVKKKKNDELVEKSSDSKVSKSLTKPREHSNDKSEKKLHKKSIEPLKKKSNKHTSDNDTDHLDSDGETVSKKIKKQKIDDSKETINMKKVPENNNAAIQQGFIFNLLIIINQNVLKYFKKINSCSS